MSMPKLIKNGRFWPFWSIRAENDQKWTQKWSKKCPIFSSSTKIFWNPGTRDFFQNPCFARVHSVGNPGTGEKMSRSRFYYFIGALFFLAWQRDIKIPVPGTGELLGTKKCHAVTLFSKNLGTGEKKASANFYYKARASLASPAGIWGDFCVPMFPTHSCSQPNFFIDCWIS